MRIPAPYRCTPFALRQRTNLETSLPKPLVDHSFLAVHNSLAPATRSNYGAGILCFTQFCDSWKISEEDRMPASAALLAAFVSCHIGSYLGKTIKSWLSGIQSWHIMNWAPWIPSPTFLLFAPQHVLITRLNNVSLAFSTTAHFFSLPPTHYLQCLVQPLGIWFWHPKHSGLSAVRLPILCLQQVTDFIFIPNCCIQIEKSCDS